ncbi:MAG: DUF1667 domain-containing protein [Clostridia bacterium]|nr:DUF1667 domain-containing protein [Clostridia bacterium]
MKKEMEMTCIVCPVGCVMHAEMDGENIQVTGNGCKRGYTYAVNEMTNPTRMVTSSVLVKGGDMPLVSVKTKEAVPKGKIDEIVSLIKQAEVKAPVNIGDVIIKNAAGTNVDVIATRNVG